MVICCLVVCYKEIYHNHLCRSNHSFRWRVSVAAWQASMFHHEIGGCYNSGIQCPICPKLHMFDKSPVLNICPYSVIVIAPPAGNRKWHVLCSNHLLEMLWHQHYIVSVYSKRLCYVKLWRTWVFIKGRVLGLIKFDVSPWKRKLL